MSDIPEGKGSNSSCQYVVMDPEGRRWLNLMTDDPYLYACLTEAFENLTSGHSVIEGASFVKSGV